MSYVTVSENGGLKCHSYLHFDHDRLLVPHDYLNVIIAFARYRSYSDQTTQNLLTP